MWLQPSPAAAPASCQDGWPVCSPSVCPAQCHCALYLEAGMDEGNECCFNIFAIMDLNNTILMLLVSLKIIMYHKLKRFLFACSVLKCDFQAKPRQL